MCKYTDVYTHEIQTPKMKMSFSFPDPDQRWKYRPPIFPF